MNRPTVRGVPVLWALLWAVLLAPAASRAIDAQRAFEDAGLQSRYERLNNELRCVQCQNQSVADSNAPIAQDLRREVRRLIAEGHTDQQIRDFMLQRYGDFVLYRPRFTLRTALLWAAPGLLLLIAVAAALRVIRGRAALAALEAGEGDGNTRDGASR